MTSQFDLLDELTGQQRHESDTITQHGSQGLLANPSAVNKLLKERFDFYCNSLKYSAFTLTFREVIRQNWKEAEIQKLTNNFMKSWQYDYESKLEWMLLPDIDEGGNFHYHGVIRIPRVSICKFKRNITKYLGYIKIRGIESPQKWLNYCYKRGEYEDRNVYKGDDIFKLSSYSDKILIDHIFN